MQTTKTLSSAGCLAAGLLVLVTSSVSAQSLIEPEVVAEWNRLTYDIKDPSQRARWEGSDIFGKALIQGLKLDSEGTMYVSTARWAGPEMPATLSRLVQEGDHYVLAPFPSEAMNDIENPDGIKSVLGFEIDRNGVMWILDQGHIAGQRSAPGAEKLILWDVEESRELQRYEFSDEDTDKQCSFLNDVAVDNDAGFAYITDSGIFCDPLDGGLIVYNREENKARRVLDRTHFTGEDPNFVFNIDNRPVLKDQPMRTGADGIALSGDKKTLYWTNLTGNRLYSIPTALLRDFTKPEVELQKAVRVDAILPSNTDGMTADRAGNVYMSALTLNGLMRRDADTGEISRLTYHPEMSWPDTLAWGPSGSLYVVSNHLHLWVDDDMDFETPEEPNFRIWKLPIERQSYTAP